MNIVRSSINKLISFCRAQDWLGYDPFDGLNSKIFQLLPFIKKQKLFRLAFLQFNKKSILNFRNLFRVSKGRNPKGIGLFLAGMVNLYQEDNNKEYLSLIEKFINWLKEDSSPRYSGYCWGYNFDWQSRAFFLPKGTPTVVNTSFIGRSFLKVYDVLKDNNCLNIARSACNFILKDFNRLESGDSICFSYSPRDNYFVHNATALASSLLAVTYEKTKEKKLAEAARKSIQYVINHQNVDGVWTYGEDPTARRTGIDSFHTGFILESIKLYMESTGDDSYVKNLNKGMDFYQNNFFLKDGTPKYFPHKIFPIDIHSATQAVITLLQLKDYGADRELCKRIACWMIENLQDKKGYFYYQKGKFFTNKIPYIRWSQAWALYALTSFLQAYE